MANTDDPIKKRDQIAMLKQRKEVTDKEPGPSAIFTYPNCGYDLVTQGLIESDGSITLAGRAALWFAGEGPDPTPGQSFERFTIPLNARNEAP